MALKKEKEIEVKKENEINNNTLETLWKLYRNVGESVEDVRTRLFDPSKNLVNIKIELKNEKLETSQSNSSQINIKIKNNLEDEKFNNENVIDIEECGTEERNECWKRNIYVSKHKTKKFNDYRNNYNVAYNYNKILKFEMYESNESISLLNNYNYDEECITNKLTDEVLNEPMQKIPNSNLFQSAAEFAHRFEVPRVKQITNAELIVNKIFQKKESKQTRNVKCMLQRNDIRAQKRKKKTSKTTLLNKKRGVHTIKHNNSCKNNIISQHFKISRLSDDTTDEEIDVINNTRDAKNINNSTDISAILSNPLHDKDKQTLNKYNESWKYFTVNLSSESDENDENLVNNGNAKT